MEAHSLLIAYSELLVDTNERILLGVFVGELLHSRIPKIEFDSVLQVSNTDIVVLTRHIHAHLHMKWVILDLLRLVPSKCLHHGCFASLRRSDDQQVKFWHLK